MSTYVMLTKLSPEALTRPGSVADLNKQVEDRVRSECPGVKWLGNYAVLGPCDYLDIFEAPDADMATKVALSGSILRSCHHGNLGCHCLGSICRDGKNSEVAMSTKVDDASQVLRQVRAALEREPRVDLHHYPLNIDLGADGALIVEGELANIAAKKLALEAAAAVPGVAAVIDRLRVAPATRMTDGAIRDHMRAALFEEPAFENCGISVRSRGVAQMVRQRNSLGFIEASVDDAVVTLNGQVGSFSHKCLAGALAWWVPGARDVINGLEVVPPQDEGDNQIAEAVGLVLAKDPLVNADRMRVRTENSVVTLEGLAANEKESEMAEMDAWCVLGVNRVINRLELE